MPVSGQDVADNTTGDSTPVPAVLHVSRDTPVLVPIEKHGEPLTTAPNKNDLAVESTRVEFDRIGEGSSTNQVQSSVAGAAPRPSVSNAALDDKSTSVIQPREVEVPENLKHRYLTNPYVGSNSASSGASSNSPEVVETINAHQGGTVQPPAARVAMAPRTGTTPSVPANQIAISGPQRGAPAPPPVIFGDEPIGSGVRRRTPTVTRQQTQVPLHAPRQTQPSRTQRPQRTVASNPYARPLRDPQSDGRTQSTPQQEAAVTSDLQLLLAGENRFGVGQESDFQLIVLNHSDQAIANVQLRLQPASGFGITVLDRAAQMDTRDQTVIWTLDEIPASDHVVIRFKAIASRAGSLVHKLHAIDGEGHETAASFSTIAVGN